MRWLVAGLMVLGGLFCVAAAAADWDLFFADRRAALAVDLLGRPGARVFYVLFGLGMAAGGVWMASALRQQQPGKP